MIFPLRGFLAAGCLFVLTACGGGGGGSAGIGGGGGGGSSPPPSGAPTYVGATTPADLSSSSVVPPLSGWLLLDVGLGDGLNLSIAGQPSGGVAAAKSSHSSMQKRFGKARQRAITLASKMSIQEVTTEPCGVSGTSELNDDGLREDGTGVVVFTYRDCAEGDGTTMNGVIRVTVAAFDMDRQEPTDYTVNYENIRITAGADSVEAGGSIRILVTGSIVTATRNTVARYLPENVYIRAQDFVETQNASSQGIGLSLRGRFYQSQYGYVDVQTPVTLAVDPTWGVATGGRILLTAVNGGARVELRFREQEALSLLLDINGDGVAERGLSAQPSELLQTIGNWLPTADAGPDVTVDEGQRVTFDAGANRDWEGAPLAFQWSVGIVPFGASPFPSGTGATYEFTPLVPGTYSVQLIVNDGSGGAAIDYVNVVVRDIPGPVANAGPDRTTLERSTVTLDGSGTSHLSQTPDTLQFAWTRTLAPANSTAPTTLTGVQPQVAVDLPGIYEYRLSVSGRGGTSTDTVRVRALAVIGAVLSSFDIGPNTRIAETTFQMAMGLSPSYTGGPLPAVISTDADWLTIDTPNVTIAGPTSVTVRLDLDALASLPNGSHRAVVRVAPSGYSEWTGEVPLQLALPSVRQVSPYVVYTGQATTVNLLGDQLQLASGRVFANGVQALGVTRESTSKARAELPALTPGEYTVRATNQLGLERPGARLIVRDPPAYPEGEVTLPGSPQMVEYDGERDVFYGLFRADNNTFLAQRFYRRSDGTWQFDAIGVQAPMALTLGLGGERLFVTTSSCDVHEIHPVTLQTLNSATKPSCSYADLGLIAALADGEVLVADTNQWSAVYRYPAFTEESQLLPMIHTPIGVMSHDRSRMLWAESPTISGPHALHVLDVLGGPSGPAPASARVTVNDAETYFSRSNLAISGDGSRFIHRGDVYDNSYQFVGSLQGLNSAYLGVALSRRGTRAAVYDNDTDELSLFDVSSGTSFPSLAVIDTFAETVIASRLTYHPDDATVFVWASVRTGGSTGSPIYEYRMFVREVP